MEQIPNIFIIEDSNFDTELFKALLKDSAYNLLYFDEPQAALDLVGTVCPQLIIIEYRMFQISGAEFMEKVKNNLQPNQNLPNCLFTVNGKLDAENKITRPLKINRILVKPLKQAELLREIEQILVVQ